MSRSKHNKYSNSTKKSVKEEYRKKLRGHNRTQLHLAETVLDADEVNFEDSKNRFSDHWNWD